MALRFLVLGALAMLARGGTSPGRLVEMLIVAAVLLVVGSVLVRR